MNDIFKMVNKMGIKVNKDEAHVLLITADSDKNNVLSMQEFLDLIFSQNDNVNVNLSEF
jgi:Ca2+-binding EF-hand superfamily protein